MVAWNRPIRAAKARRLRGEKELAAAGLAGAGAALAALVLILLLG